MLVVVAVLHVHSSAQNSCCLLASTVACAYFRDFGDKRTKRRPSRLSARRPRERSGRRREHGGRKRKRQKRRARKQSARRRRRKRWSASR